MLLCSIVALMFVDPSLTMSGLLSASNRAVSLSFELCAIYAIFNILEQTGISKKLTKLLSPLIDLIFGKNNLSASSKQFVSMNMSANMLGMNGAATPMGIKAIESMSHDSNSDEVTFPMTMLIILSCSSLQLLPTSIVSLLSTAGASNPSSIILPSIVASILSTTIGIVLVRIWHKFKTRKKTKRMDK